MQTPFSQEIAALERGALDADLTEALQEVAAAVLTTERKGSVTLTLTLSKEAHTDKVVRIDADIKSKVPKRGRPSSIRFGTKHGHLLRDDPDQQEFELTTVDQQTGEIMSIPQGENA